jgi:magnesium-protoporphyrin O-methyltransferase
LLDALQSEGIQGMSLLDIGGGVGVIQHELLKTGLHSAVNVEASTASIEAAKEEAVRQGHADRVQYYRGDFTNLATELAPADIVTLDRVLCCYHDVRTLVGLSAARARRLYGLVYPRDIWWMKAAIAALNIRFWLQRNPFRIFVHSTETVDALVRSNGLEPRFKLNTRLWQVVVYARLPKEL